MKLPSSWDDILVDQYIELRGLDNELPYFDLMLETISIVTDTDIDELEELSFNELVAIEKQLVWLTSEPSKNVNTYLTFQKEEEDLVTQVNLSYKGLDDLMLREFIDLNHYFSENFVEELPTIAAILYRQTKLNEWNETIIEPYEYDPRNRRDLFMEVGIVQIYGIITSFLEYKSNFEETYANLFKPDLSDEDIDDLDEETKREIAEEERLDKFSWERLIYSLTDGDITKTDKVLNLSVVYVFNVLSMKKALDI
jgi:hypothetical protein